MGIRIKIMSIENPTINSSDRKRKSLEQIIDVRIKGYIDNVITENPGAPVNFETFLKGLDRLIKRIKELISNKDVELSEIYDSIAALKIENGEEFVKTVNARLSEFLLTSFSFEEIESMSRRGKRMLNRLIEYNIGKDEVDIHVPATFLENPSELRSLFTDALRKLADKLQNDPEFQNVKRVFAKSWIVFRIHELLEKKFGFTILELDEENKDSSAEISKEKLIELYGNK